MAVTLVAPQQQLGSSDPGTQVYVVIGSSADVTAGRATHTWATAQALNGATGPAAGTAIKVLVSAGALTANLLWTAANLIVVGESNNVTVPLGGFTFTISGATCFVDLIFSGAVAGSVVITGLGSQLVSPGLLYNQVSLGRSTRADLMGQAALHGGYTDAHSGWTSHQIPNIGVWDLNGIAYSPTLNLYVMVGGTGSVIAPGNADAVFSGMVISISSDGVSWVRSYVPNTVYNANIQLNAVIWAAGLNLFIAVGITDGTNPAITTSPDGITWTKATSAGGNHNLYAIAWNGTTLVAVGDNDGTNPIVVTSTNGTTWTKQTSAGGATGNLYGITWNGSTFVAVGGTAAGAGDGTNPLIICSANGTSGWANATTRAGGNFGLLGITWNGSIFVACGFRDATGSAIIVTSPTGTGTWTKQYVPNANIGALFNIVWSPQLNQFVAVGQAVEVVYGNATGTTWTTTQLFTQPNATGGAAIRNCLWNPTTGLYLLTAGKVTTPYSFSAVYTSPDPAYYPSLVGASRLYPMRPMVQGGPKTIWAVQPETQPAGLLSQADYLMMRGPYCKRTTVTAPIMNGVLNQIAFDNSTWTNVATGLGTASVNGIANGGNNASTETLVIVGASNGTNGLIATSTNSGAGWSNIVSGLGAFNLNGIAFNGLVFCVVGNSNGTNSLIATSPDGATWTNRSTGAALGNFNLQAICWSPELGLFVVVGASTGSHPLIATSPDGITWTNRTNTIASVTLFGVAWIAGLGLFVAVGGTASGVTGVLATSPDGITWTQQTIPNLNNALNSVAWNGKTLVAAGLRQTSGPGLENIMYSTNGINWSAPNPLYFSVNGNTHTINALIWAPMLNLFIAACNSVSSGPYVLVSQDGIYWKIGAFSNQASGNPGGLCLIALVNPAGTTGSLIIMCGASNTSNGIVLTSPDAGLGLDTNLNWDVEDHRYVPSVPGLYKVYLQVVFSTIQATDAVLVAIRKNGTATAQSGFTNQTSVTDVSMTVSVEDIIDCNGYTDYIDFAAQAAASTTFGVTATQTYCLIERLP